MVAFAEKFEAGTRAKILDRMPPATRQAFESSPRTSWSGIEDDHWVVDGVVNALGRKRAVECWRSAIPDLIDKPLLHGFVSGMVRLFGRDPARIIGLVPKGWPLVFRNFCDLRSADGDGQRAIIHFERVAPEVKAYPNYFHSWDGILQGVLLICRVDGTVDFTVGRDMTSAEAIVRWG